MKNSIHFVLQAKGGIGKSFISTLLAQHLLNEIGAVRCFDTDQENDGFFVKTAYRYPTRRVAPGAAVDPKDMAPLTGLVVKSIISAPVDGNTVKIGSAVKVMGWAWAGESNITKVDISLDNGMTWMSAKLGRDQARYSWRQFEYEWKAAEVGSFLVMSRATDDKGREQPVAAQWNPSGYLWNVIDRVRINVEA